MVPSLIYAPLTQKIKVSCAAAAAHTERRESAICWQFRAALFIYHAHSLAHIAVSRRRRASAKRDALDTDRAIYSAGEKFKSTGRRGSLRPLSASTALDASLINETLLEQIAQLAAKRLD